MKIHFFILFIIFPYNSVICQSSDNAPVVYDQFFKNYFLVNPAINNADNKLDISLGNRTLTGLFEGVNRFYADGNIVFSPKSENRYHSIGLLAMNNKDGEYISRSRAYARYAYYTSISENASLSAGIAFGFINYSFKASPASGGGNSFSPDANIGLWYLRDNFKVGISYQQITRPVLKPVSQQFQLDPYLNFNIIYKLKIQQHIELESHLYYRYLQDFPFYFEFSPILSFYNKLETGVNYRQNRGFAILLGLKSIAIGNNHFRFLASYLLSTRKLTTINDGILEFSFGYSLPN
ncbi:MAG: PorP/SprF family type IX secretion system membrane protein [Opitutaceae bacterium]|nr:PorP/SprF family type IX secretion system membrane protein [Cytophagales bacterium]